MPLTLEMSGILHGLEKLVEQNRRLDAENQLLRQEIELLKMTVDLKQKQIQLLAGGSNEDANDV